MKYWSVVLLFCTLFLGIDPAQAAAREPQPPPGFVLLYQQIGVWLYRKDYTNGTPDYVQVIDLGQGAGLRLLYGPVSSERPGRGAYGGDDARLGFNSLEGFWQQIQSQDSRAFCVANGQFFYMPESPTRLALPLKVDGQVITEGFGYDQYPEKLMLELWDDHARISLLTEESLYKSTAPDILGGLPEDANKRAPYSVGRTFIGVDDWDDDGWFEVVYLFNTPTASQGAVAQVLRDFGAESVMMLDGGGSTQLICQGKPLISSDRLIPQAIAVLAALSEAATEPTATQPVDPVILTPRTTQDTIVEEKIPQATQSVPDADREIVPEKPQDENLTPRLGNLLLVPLLMAPVFIVFFLLLRAEH